MIKPNSTHGIPIDMVHNGTLVIQPITTGEESYYWSVVERAFEFSALMKRTNVCLITTCPNRKEKEAAKAFYAVVKSMFEDTKADKQVKEKFSQDSPTLLQCFSCAIELRPPVALQNLFATKVRFALYDRRVKSSIFAYMPLSTGTLAPGELLPIHSTNLKNNIYLSLKPDGDWTETQAMIFSNDGKTDELGSSIGIKDKLGRELQICLDYEDTGIAYRNVTFYCLFWIINKTGLKLGVADNNEHEAAGQTDDLVPLPYSVPEKVRKIKIRVNNSGWSNSFPLDNVGVSGNLTCAEGDTKYAIGMYNIFGPGQW